MPRICQTAILWYCQIALDDLIPPPISCGRSPGRAIYYYVDCLAGFHPGPRCATSVVHWQDWCVCVSIPTRQRRRTALFKTSGLASSSIAPVDHRATNRLRRPLSLIFCLSCAFPTSCNVTPHSHPPPSRNERQKTMDAFPSHDFMTAHKHPPPPPCVLLPPLAPRALGSSLTRFSCGLVQPQSAIPFDRTEHSIRGCGARSGDGDR